MAFTVEELKILREDAIADLERRRIELELPEGLTGFDPVLEARIADLTSQIEALGG